MAERSCGEQFDTDLVRHHVSEVQTQLGIAVQGSASAASTGSVKLQIAAILTRINGNRTSANDDVPGFESLGEGAASARASAEAVNRVLRMMMLRLLECDWGPW